LNLGPARSSLIASARVQKRDEPIELDTEAFA
jgi:hypothetical protein